VAWLDELRPIRLFSFYLMLIFLIGTALRWRQYHAVLSLVARLRGRWPNLTQLILTHKHIFLTWNTLLPLILTLVVFLTNFLAARLVWPQADAFTVGELREVWPLLGPVLTFGACMLIIDVWGTVSVGQIDLKQTEGYFDLAEKWLRGWRAPVVRWLSLGYVNPRQMVNDQVRDALTQGSKLLHTNLWWMVAQTAWRIGFGASLWVGYVCWLHGWLRGVLGD
jgi:hypothetical protein